LIKRRRSLAVVKILQSGDVERFLAEIEKDIQKEKQKVYKNMLLINKTAGLYYSGEWQQALEILDAINPRKLPRLSCYLYYNNKLANLLLAERIEDARVLVEENQKIFQRASKIPVFINSIQGNIAVLKYFQGRYEESGAMLEKLIHAEQNKLFLAVRMYYLGRIYLNQGKMEEGKKLIRDAAAGAPQTFIFRKANELLSRL
jgi:tetratricopeptide (TPR) repeat protein